MSPDPHAPFDPLDHAEGRWPAVSVVMPVLNEELHLADAVRRIGEDVRDGRLSPRGIDERTIGRYLYHPEVPDVDLFVRSSGEQRTSNFLLWQSAYAEMVFQDTLWPDYDRRHLWQAIETYASRDRRYGGAVDAQA